MAEAVLCQFLGPGLRKLTASTSCLLGHLFREVSHHPTSAAALRAPCCEKPKPREEVREETLGAERQEVKEHGGTRHVTEGPVSKTDPPPQ